MNLECLNDIITDKLAIHIDLTDIKSWRNWNSGLTAFSLTKWSGAVSDNINLIDFGLTAFDNGRTNVMWSGITLTPSDTLFSMYRVGYNVIHNPTTGETSGVTATTFYYPISAITTGATENYYFDLTGGYLQGFFKLQDYNYTLFPSRYGAGITLETILYLYPDSQGIFLMLGARAEDKYNKYFSGETITGKTTIFDVPSTGITITGITTSLNNYLDDIKETQVVKSGFKLPEDKMKNVYSQVPQVGNIKNNAIAFELTQDRRIAYKYINNDGLIITNSSPAIITATGYTIIDIVFTPNDVITDPAVLECAQQRLGKMIFYVNGRAVWIIHDFPEYYFHSFSNQKEKQLGVPYSISWVGGSFGLENSWHYDYQTYIIYKEQNTTYINSKFFVEEDPLPSNCYVPPTGDTYLAGLSLSADSTTFKAVDVCDPTIEYPVTVMRIEYTGTTGTTGTTGATKYFIKFNQPISVLSNRDYVIDLSIFNNGIFKTNDSGTTVNNKISVLVYGTVDVDIIKETEYVYPLTYDYLNSLSMSGLHPFPDRQEYEYIYLDKKMYYGVTGIPVYDASGNMNNVDEILAIINASAESSVATGEGNWNQLKTTFRTKDNTGQQFVYIGLLIESDAVLNTGSPLFVKDFTYTGADILVQDERKNNLTIEQNFNSGFIGGIQKLRIYDNAFTAPEVLHNALMESKANPNVVVSKGGRIIYR